MSRSQGQANLNTHWTQIEEAGSALGMRFMMLVHRLLGRLPFRLVLWPVVTWYFVLNSRARAASTEYLQRVGTAPTGWFGSWRHFVSFGETLLDKLLAMSGRYNFHKVHIEGLADLERATADGRGALLITAHVGNLELCRALAARHPTLKLTILVFTKHAEKFNRMIARLNPGAQVELMQVTDINPATILHLSERIARGELVVISGDRIPVSENPRVAEVDFLGHKAAFAVGPYILASLLQCPVVVLFCVRARHNAQFNYRVIFQHFSDLVQLPRASRDAACQQLAQDFANRLATLCRDTPLEWFNFYPFWAMPTSLGNASRNTPITQSKPS